MENKTGKINLKPATTQKASEVIYEQLAELITSGELTPGEKLPSERDLMQMLNRSRPTVREALRMLERNGLIQTVPGSGAIVTQPTIEIASAPLGALLSMNYLTSHELLEYRRFNDVAFTIWAAERRTDSDLEKLKLYLDQVDRNKNDNELFSTAYADFFTSVAVAGKNRLAQIIQTAIAPLEKQALLQSLSKYGDIQETYKHKEHIVSALTTIFHAIEKSDYKLASENTKNHLQDIKQDIILN